MSVLEEKEGNHAIEVGMEARRMPASSVLGRAALEELSKHNVCGGESPSKCGKERKRETNNRQQTQPAMTALGPWIMERQELVTLTVPSARVMVRLPS